MQLASWPIIQWVLAQPIPSALIFILIGILLWSGIRVRRLKHEILKRQSEQDRTREEALELTVSNASLLSQLQASQQIEVEKQSQCDHFNEQLQELNHQFRQQSTAASGEVNRLQAEKKALEDKLDQFEKNRQKMQGEFELLANRIFDEKTQRFTKDNESHIQKTLEPLRQQIGDFRKRVDDVYTNEAKERHALAEQISKLREDSIRISHDADNLTKALKHDNKAQGNWGELTLQRALEACGLKEGMEFHTQYTSNEEGMRTIPDVVVHLPGEKDIIIDSKVSLLAYTRYFEADSEEEERQAVKDHLQSIRSHVKGLSSKNYSSIESLRTLDYVMLYIPVEGASMLALQNDPELWSFAYSKNIVLVGPSNLLAILRSVETIWRHERQNKNAEKIAAEAGKLHDQFVLFAESLEEVGKQLDKARDAYDNTQRRLVSGRGNLLRRVENLEKLGAKTQRQIPERLMAAADSDESALDDEVTSEAPNALVSDIEE